LFEIKPFSHQAAQIVQKALFLFLCLFVAVFTTAQAQKPAPPAEPHDHSHMSKSAESSPAQKYFTDVELINQDGKKVHFYSDVLKGKTVIVNAFFTSCTSVCPPMNRNMEKIQEALGDRAGRDVFLVSMTVDPETDTPVRMKEYAKKFHAGPGWIFLTGKKENLDWALYKLGQYVETKDDHTTVLIIGNEPTGLWKKAFGMANVAELVQVVESVVNDKGATK
jgi:protein SCO1/2